MFTNATSKKTANPWLPDLSVHRLPRFACFFNKLFNIFPILGCRNLHPDLIFALWYYRIVDVGHQESPLMQFISQSFGPNRLSDQNRLDGMDGFGRKDKTFFLHQLFKMVNVFPKVPQKFPAFG